MSDVSKCHDRYECVMIDMSKCHDRCE